MGRYCAGWPALDRAHRGIGVADRRRTGGVVGAVVGRGVGDHCVVFVHGPEQHLRRRNHRPVALLRRCIVLLKVPVEHVEKKQRRALGVELL